VDPVVEQEIPRLTTTTLPMGVDSGNPFDEMMSRFDVAAQKLGLDPGLYKVLREPVRETKVSIPVVMDDGRIEVSNVGGQLKAHTGDGIIRINQARGTVDADSGDGAIDVDGRLDVVTVRTGDGSVRVAAADGSNMKSEWRITTGDGRISLRVPNGFNAAVDASTGDGSVHVDGIPNASSKGGDSNRHRVAGQLGSGGAALTLRSGDGSIDVTH